MIYVSYESIVVSDLVEGCIDNTDYDGFLEDFRVVHCLMRRARPSRVLEVGTYRGKGVRLIANAVGPGCEVLSLDLPDDYAHLSRQHAVHHGVAVGDLVRDVSYTQLRGDSLQYDFSQHAPVDVWFIDGEHDEEHVFQEASAAVAMRSPLIVFHDADMPEVAAGIEKTFAGTDYKLHRVVGTRVAFATL